MAYTPELDLVTVRIVRRIAWSMDLPMTVALPAMIAWLAIHLDSQKIRTACRAPVDCDDCPFSAEKVEKM